MNISAATTLYLIRDLKSSTKYHIELVAVNKFLTSEPSVIEVTTQKSRKLQLSCRLAVIAVYITCLVVSACI